MLIMGDAVHCKENAVCVGTLIRTLSIIANIYDYIDLFDIIQTVTG